VEGVVSWYPVFNSVIQSANNNKHNWLPGWELTENLPTGRSVCANTHSKDHTPYM
jgi:hypothetical protein